MANTVSLTTNHYRSVAFRIAVQNCSPHERVCPATKLIGPTVRVHERSRVRSVLRDVWCWARHVGFARGPISVASTGNELKLLGGVVLSLKCLLAVSPAAFRTGSCLA